MNKLMELIDDLSHCMATYHLESIYGTSKAYTAEKLKELGKARAAVVEAVEKLERDAARMEWLDRYIHIATWVDGEPTKLVIDAASGDEFTGETWGEALDKAMEATNGQGN